MRTSCSRRENENDDLETKEVKCRLKWSLNVGGHEDVSYQIPRSTNAALSLLEDQCCRIPIYSTTTTTTTNNNNKLCWIEDGYAEMAIFLASNSKNRIELTVHDPTESLSTCYQLEINDNVMKMELVALPPGNKNNNNNEDNALIEQQQRRTRAFGVLLVLATCEGISIFSLVFTDNALDNDSTTSSNNNGFAMSECLELSDFESTGPNLTSLKDRRVREIKSKVVFSKKEEQQQPSFRDGDNNKKKGVFIARTGSFTEEGDDKNDNNSQDDPSVAAAAASWLPTLAVVTSSLPNPPTRTTTTTTTTATTRKQIPSSTSYNVDVLFFYIRDHQCPIFQYQANDVSRRHSCNSLALLRDAGKVVNVAFLGNRLRDKTSDLIIAILLAGELKLIPIPASGALKPRNLKVQTVLLTGICAHPSISDLGEAVLVESNETVHHHHHHHHHQNGSSKGSSTTTTTIAILCRPKINEIGFIEATPTLSNALISVQKTVSFSPVEIIKEDPSVASGGDGPNNHRFFPSNDATPIIRKTGLHKLQESTPSEDCPNGVEADKDTTKEVSLVSPDSQVSGCDTEVSNRIRGADYEPTIIGRRGNNTNDKSMLKEAIRTPLPESRDHLKTVSTTSSISYNSLSTASPLVGLQLVNTSCVKSMKERTSLLQQHSANVASEVLDLTGKFAASDNKNDTDLTPLSGLVLDESQEYYSDDATLQIQIKPATSVSQIEGQGKQPLFTPVNCPATRHLGTRSALKSIQRTTYSRQERTPIPTTTSEESLPHVIFVTVERAQRLGAEKGSELGGIHCKVNISAVAIPAPEATLECASMKWGKAPDSAQSKLFVATNSKSNIRIAEIVCGDEEGLLSPRLTIVKSCSLGGVLKELEQTKGPGPYKMKAVSVVAKKNGHSSDLEMRLLLCRAAKSGAIPSTPINMSPTTEAKISLACVALTGGGRGPLGDEEKETAEDEGTALLQEMMSFMQNHHEKMMLGMAELEKRIGVIEEAMRTI